MDKERTHHALRTRSQMQPPVKQTTPAPTKKSVSVAKIFKKQSRKTRKASVTPQSAVKVPRLTIEVASDAKTQSLKSHSSSRSPQKAEWKVSKRRSDLHPLAVAFKETSDDYRRHLYRSTTLKINKTLETLLHNLYQSTLQTIWSDANDSQDEPLRLTVSAKFEREANKLYLPISAYQVRLTFTNTGGERVPLMGTLHTRMQDFEEHLKEEKAGIEKLRKDWETIVGEIWKVGVHCLGKEAMESLLFTQKATHEALSSPSRAESTLFVPEHDEPPPPRKARGKKRVTFEAPQIDDDDELSTASNMSLDFLYQPTRLRAKPLDAVPVVPEDDVRSPELQIEELGKKEITEYRKVETDYHAHWQKKTAQLLDVFKN